MTALRFLGGVRHRAHAAGTPAPLPPGRRPPDSPESRGQPCPLGRAEPLEPRTLLATFVVTTTADEGAGSLRQAILDANASAGLDAVHFAIPGEAVMVHTIRPRSPLPSVTDPLTLDATTQPGYAATPLIELDGSAAGADVDGLTVLARPSAVRGFAINGFSRHGVLVCAPGRDANVSIERNHIGTDPAGTAARANGGAGVVVESVRTLVGGRVPLSGDIISGNRLAGIWASSPFDAGPDASSASHNYVGTNRAGDAAVPNGTSGVLVDSGTFVVERNLISGNLVSGVHVTGGSAQPNLVQNLIGTDATGSSAVPNATAASAALLGGVTVSGGANPTLFGNTISGNAAAGVNSVDSSVGLNGNRIGTNLAGTAALPNDGHGVVVTGGTRAVLTRNTVSANRGDGVRLVEVRAAALSRSYVAENVIGVDSARANVLGNAGNGISVIGGINFDLQFIPPEMPVPPRAA